ncbi:MAG: protein-L-isoaspartate(D-aspartate) O-methyltransferase [bacterium]
MPRLPYSLLAAAGLLVTITVGGAAIHQQSGGTEPGREAVARDFDAARMEMVARQIESRGVSHPALLDAMRTVPRHEFVPAALRQSAYDDCPLPIGEGQTISQPYIVALMTEALSPGATDRVLELGTGSGYQAAILAAIVDSVYTIEYVPSLAARAQVTLERLGFDNVVVKTGDGWRGWSEHAPFDAIMVTFAAPELPTALVEQLRPGGRICIPLGQPNTVQELMLYTKSEDGTVRGRSLGAVRFVPVLGEGGQPRRGLE